MIRLLIIFITALTVTTAANADAVVRCSNAEQSECIDRVYDAFYSLGCNVDPEFLKCNSTAEQDGAIFCVVGEMSNCTEPRPELFGFTSAATTCSSGKKKSLSKVDPDLTLAWTMGLLNGYVKDICVN